MIFATIEIAQSVVGVVTPIISLVLLMIMRSVFKGNQNIEKAITETEGEVITKIDNGVSNRLDTIIRRQNEFSGRLTKLEEKIK